MARETITTLISGKKRIGKSHRTLTELLYYAFISKAGRKSLIVDLNNEYSQYPIENKVHNIKLIGSSPKDLIEYSNFKGGDVRRIAPITATGMPMSPEEASEMVSRAVTYFRNGILYIEDFNSLFSDSISQKISGTLTNNAHRGCDLMLTVQSIGRATPRLIQNTNLFRFHDQLDDVEKSKDKLTTDFEIFKVAQVMIKKEVDKGNIRFFLWIDKDSGRIRGEYSPKMLTESIQEYLAQYPNQITILLRRRDAKGKSIYGYEQALQLKVIELFKKYYGN